MNEKEWKEVEERFEKLFKGYINVPINLNHFKEITKNFIHSEIEQAEKEAEHKGYLHGIDEARKQKGLGNKWDKIEGARELAEKIGYNFIGCKDCKNTFKVIQHKAGGVFMDDCDLCESIMKALSEMEKESEK